MSSQSTAFKISTFSNTYLLPYFSLAHCVCIGSTPKINFITNKHNNCTWHTLPDLLMPLYTCKSTFLIAFTSDDFSVTAKVIKNMSVLGYARGRRRAYYSCPAVSLHEWNHYQRPRFIIFPSIFRVVVELSKIVGTYSVGKRFWV